MYVKRHMVVAMCVLSAFRAVRKCGHEMTTANLSMNRTQASVEPGRCGSSDYWSFFIATGHDMLFYMRLKADE